MATWILKKSIKNVKYVDKCEIASETSENSAITLKKKDLTTDTRK